MNDSIVKVNYGGHGVFTALSGFATRVSLSRPTGIANQIPWEREEVFVQPLIMKAMRVFRN